MEKSLLQLITQNHTDAFSLRHTSVCSRSALCVYHHKLNAFCHTEYFYKTVLEVQNLMKLNETGLKKNTAWVKVKNT